MPWVALKRLKWGDDWIDPGDAVPEDEPGRDYQQLAYRGHIAPVKEAAEMTDAELAAELERVTKQRDDALAELEAGPPVVKVPDQVSPGETPGWPLDATTGKPLGLTDDQRAALAEKGVSGAAVITHTGELIVLDPPGADAGESATGDQESDDAEADAGGTAKQPAKRKPAKKQPAK